MTDEERAHRCFTDWGIRDEPLQIRFAKAIGAARAEGFRAGVEAALVAAKASRKTSESGAPVMWGGRIITVDAEKAIGEILTPPQESA